MKDLICSLNQNAGAVQAVCAFLIFVVTVFYVFFTWRMVREMRRTNERLEAPNIQALLTLKKPTVSAYELILRNWGNAPAFRIRVNISPGDAPALIGTTLSEVRMFKNEIPAMAEREELRGVLLDAAQVKEDLITFDISYENAQGKTYSQRYSYDLRMMDGFGELGPEQSANDAVEGLAKNLNSALQKITARLESMTVVALQSHYHDIPIRDLLNIFEISWDDFKNIGHNSFVGLNLDRMILLCEELYARSCAAGFLTEECREFRRKILRLARTKPHPLGWTSEEQNEFLRDGDDAVNTLKRVKETFACRLAEPPNRLDNRFE